MKTLMITAAAIAMLAGTASADPVLLGDTQLQGETAGLISGPLAVTSVAIATPTSVNNVVNTDLTAAIGVLSEGVLATSFNALGAANGTGIGTPAP